MTVIHISLKRWALVIALAAALSPNVSGQIQPPANVRLIPGNEPPPPPPNGIPINPGEDVQARVASAPAGTAFVLKAGIHRMQTISPKEGDSFTGEAGTVLSGARLLSSFARLDGYWVANGQTQEGSIHGECDAAFPRCNRPEELFIDHQRLVHVSTLAAVGPGKWFFDYVGDRLYLADDPTGRTVEISVAATAFAPTANNVTVTGLIVEKYANPAQSGVINADTKVGWIIAGNEVRLNHGAGIRIGKSAQVRQNNVHHNGQIGITGAADDAVVEGNEIAYNNDAHFNPFWEGGGSKFSRTRNLILRNNFVHHNYGPGLWTDTDNIDTLFEGNTCEDNQQMGIYHEVSYAAVIRNNVIRRNGFGHQEWIWGAGILVAGSPNVEVYGNTLEGNADGIGAAQQNRGSGAYGPHEISNLWVHDNRVTMAQGRTGLVQDNGDVSYFTSRNNRFTDNHYSFLASDEFFTWMDADHDEVDWKTYGQDVNGSFVYR